LRRFFFWFAIAATLAVLVWQLWPDRVIEREFGVLCPDEPLQVKPTRTSPWLHGDFMITALADYDIRARVLSRRDYSGGDESDISPVDFALGWGPMSDEFVLEKLEISQGHRWYKWKVKDLMPIPQKDIERNSANVHILPANETVEESIDKVYLGSVVHMKGYLVKVTREGNWRWVSSTTLNDTGDGACEVFWVEAMTVENE
jgi:hypothetical protein